MDKSMCMKSTKACKIITYPSYSIWGPGGDGRDLTLAGGPSLTLHSENIPTSRKNFTVNISQIPLFTSYY